MGLWKWGTRASPCHCEHREAILAPLETQPNVAGEPLLRRQCPRRHSSRADPGNGRLGYSHRGAHCGGTGRRLPCALRPSRAPSAPDPAQQRASSNASSNSTTASSSATSRTRNAAACCSLLHVRNGNGVSAPRGIYLVGPVGRGKSMLMDLFFAAAPVEAKQRVHFHAFMLKVHNRMEVERRAETRSPILKVVADLAAEAAAPGVSTSFQVNDIADAMILGASSSRSSTPAPSWSRPRTASLIGFYENGLQRDRFLPFIDLLKERPARSISSASTPAATTALTGCSVSRSTTHAARRRRAASARSRLRRSHRARRGPQRDPDRDGPAAHRAARRPQRRLVQLR